MKWELFEEGKEMTKVIHDYDSWYCDREEVVVVDVYRKKKWDGTYKYKIIERWGRIV